MANSSPPELPDQTFPENEHLFRRVRRENMKRGKATFLAFALPDMSVNREKLGSTEDARKGFDPADWGVVAFLAKDIPPRTEWQHIAQVYRLLPRHVPTAGSFPHSEVRVWRQLAGAFVLITARQLADFALGDPDRDESRGLPESLLDPDFHMRWRKHIALVCKTVLPPEDAAE